MVANKVKKRENKIRDKKREIINILGIKEHFEKLPIEAKKPILNFTWPKTSIDTDDARNFPNIKVLEEKIKNLLNNSTIDVNGHEIPFQDLNQILGIDSAVYSMKSFLISRIGRKNELISKKIGDPVKVLELFNIIEKSTSKNAVKAWYDCAIKLVSIAWQETSKYYSFTQNGLYFTLSLDKSPGGKAYQIIKIHESYPEVRLFNMDGKPRNAYSCFCFDHLKKFPLVLKENTINNVKPVKVYIQEHAINRINERLRIHRPGDMFYSLGKSLINPKVCWRDGDSHLVEFYFHGNKVGYLVVSPVEDVALIKSFKFITMSGTPEHQMLKAKFGACRKDFEYFGMDTIDFINSDVFNDPELRQIFKKCNLSHLFEIKKQLTFDSPEFCMAADIKKYFRI